MTRYPKRGKKYRWTVKELEAIPTDWQALAHGVRRKDENAEVKHIFYKDVLPAIGACPCAACEKRTCLAWPADRRKAARPVVLTTQIALWVGLGALTRIGETVKARWEHVDFAERTWFIPKENVKRVRGGSRGHVVHLSDFLFDLFRLLKPRTGHSPYGFPSRPVESALMETLGVEDKIIDLCQNHAIHTGANKVRRHYLHADNGPRMRKAWDLVSEHLIRVVGRPEGLIAAPVPRATLSVHDVLRDVA